MTFLLPDTSAAPFTEVGQVWASASVYLACFQPLPLHLLPKWSRFGLLLRYTLPASGHFRSSFYRSRAGFSFCFGMTCLLPVASSAPFTEVGQVWASASVCLACFRTLPQLLLPKWSRFWLLLRYALPASGRFLCAFYRSRAGLGFCFGISCLLSAASSVPFTEVEQVWASASVIPQQTAFISPLQGSNV